MEGWDGGYYGASDDNNTNNDNQEKDDIDMSEETVKVYPEDTECLGAIMAESAKLRSYKDELTKEMIESTAAMGRLFGWNQKIEHVSQGTLCYLMSGDSKRFFVSIQDGYLNLNLASISSTQNKRLFSNALAEFVHDKQDTWFLDTSPHVSTHGHFSNGVVIDRQARDSDDNYLRRLRIPYKVAVEQKALKQILGSYIANMHNRIANESMPNPDGYEDRVKALKLNATLKI